MPRMTDKMSAPRNQRLCSATQSVISPTVRSELRHLLAVTRAYDLSIVSKEANGKVCPTGVGSAQQTAGLKRGFFRAKPSKEPSRCELCAQVLIPRHSKHPETINFVLRSGRTLVLPRPMQVSASPDQIVSLA